MRGGFRRSATRQACPDLPSAGQRELRVMPTDPDKAEKFPFPYPRRCNKIKHQETTDIVNCACSLPSFARRNALLSMRGEPANCRPAKISPS